MRQKSAAVLQEELDKNRQQLTSTMERSDQLEEAGDPTPENVTEMQVLTARGQLLRGAIKRLDGELRIATKRESLERITELRGIMETETEAAKVAADKLAEKVIKLLVPEPGIHPSWNTLFCERRRHEIRVFAGQHPDVTKHIEAGLRAKSEIDALHTRLRGAA